MIEERGHYTILRRFYNSRIDYKKRIRGPYPEEDEIENRVANLGYGGGHPPIYWLAGGLSSVGNDVTLAVTEITNKDFTYFGERFDFDIRHVGHIEYDELKFKQLALKVFCERNPIKRGDILISNFFDPVVEDMFSAAETLCSDNDIVIIHFFYTRLKLPR